MALDQIIIIRENQPYYLGWGGGGGGVIAKYRLNNKTGPFLEFNRWKMGFS